MANMFKAMKEKKVEKKEVEGWPKLNGPVLRPNVCQNTIGGIVSIILTLPVYTLLTSFLMILFRTKNSNFRHCLKCQLKKKKNKLHNAVHAFSARSTSQRKLLQFHLVVALFTRVVIHHGRMAIMTKLAPSIAILFLLIQQRQCQKHLHQHLLHLAQNQLHQIPVDILQAVLLDKNNTCVRLEK
jgi:hypothetical protein